MFVIVSTTYTYLNRLVARGLKVVYYLLSYVARFMLVACYSILILQTLICCLQLRLTRNSLRR